MILSACETNQDFTLAISVGSYYRGGMASLDGEPMFSSPPLPGALQDVFESQLSLDSYGDAKEHGPFALSFSTTTTTDTAEVAATHCDDVCRAAGGGVGCSELEPLARMEVSIVVDEEGMLQTLWEDGVGSIRCISADGTRVSRE
jgi:hypothetical protein